MNRTLAENIIRGRRAISAAKQLGLDTSVWEQALGGLFQEAGRKPSLEEGIEPWMLWEWRRVSIPEWRRILRECIESRDGRREEYARWMLREVLLDPDYSDVVSP